ncbi:very short patch repair endonuclease [Roseovarius sp. EGI FJ00037]|uniref:very short patch repair endonuclease n=1 Tax=Roseovarius salincola TaxID=2978479 RepID=UPI0022A8B6BC|nr:very short patch repair endonuclease [Roseovarius sp. EGI FJ00037]MCZ0811871.1 very short patch repair endonuclease [Roseovarius sp. EGI FJ00037]
MDRVGSETRSRIMASVGQKNTGAELTLRRGLHRAGIRYRLHGRELPGRPDLVLPRFGAVIFVHGCYWHSHGCYRSTVPKTREDFWRDKFAANRARDARNDTALRERHWRVMTVWECALKGKTAWPLEEVVASVIRWLHSGKETGVIEGHLSGLISKKVGSS